LAPRAALIALAALVLTATPLASAPADVVRYRTRDGQIGFVDDPARVPAGAAILPAPDAEPERLQVVEPDSAVPPVTPVAGQLEAQPPQPVPFEEAAEEALAAEERARKEREEVREEILSAQRELEAAREARRGSCGNGYYGRRPPRFDNRTACYADTQRMQAAEQKLREIRAELEEEFEDTAEFFPDGEAEQAEGQGSADEPEASAAESADPGTSPDAEESGEELHE
jgi:hypothetical protein